MNGEMAQMSNIVICARIALHDKGKIDCLLDKYVTSIKFVFIPKGIFLKKAKTADSISDWFEICRKQGLEDIKYLVPTSVTDLYILGFSNTSQNSMVCFWKDGSVTYFMSRWEFDRDREGWDVTYEEHEWKDAPAGKPSFENRTEEFKQVLLAIEDLAKRIEFDSFAMVFHKAYLAVMKADVFGAMGSWNDSPPYYAHEKGLDKEYNELSDQLLEQLRYNLMYIVNEC